MASSYPAPVSAVQVGSFFVRQYYQVLQQQPDCAHQFYTDASTMIRVDGELSDTASALLQIHTLVMSLNFSGIEIKTINSLESWRGGVLVAVSGSVKSKEFSGWRKFMQTFLLAPQETGYFVLNDIFHFLSEKVIHQHPAPMSLENKTDYQHQTPIFSENRVDYQHPGSTLQDRVDYQHPTPVYLENRVDSQLNNSSSLSESPDVPDYEVEVSEHFDSVHIEGDEPADEYSLHDQQQQEEPVVEFVKETPVEDSSALNNVVDHEQEPSPAVEESIGESKSVYVKNLPPTVSTLDILQEVENFGRVKPDGVFIKNRKELGVCFAFVEFEDVECVQNEIKASPIQLVGRQVYIEERRPSSSSYSNISRGGNIAAFQLS